MRKKQYGVLKWIVTASIITLIVTLSNTANVEHVNADNHHKMKEKPVQQQKSSLTHEDIVALTNTFIDILVQDVDNDYKVVQYQTKAELLQAFGQVTTEDVAQEFVDFYYTEETDGLYILPTETPPWFIEENDYDMITIDTSTVKVMQENTTDLYGDYKVEFEFTYDNGWRITDINYHHFSV